MKKIIELFGWYGVIAIVLAYALVSFSILKSTDLAYQLLNITGAMGIIVDSFYKRDYQPVILNIIWMLIALAVILKILF